MEPRRQVDGTRDYTQFDAPETRDAGFASSILRRRSILVLQADVGHDADGDEDDGGNSGGVALQPLTFDLIASQRGEVSYQ